MSKVNYGIIKLTAKYKTLWNSLKIDLTSLRKYSKAEKRAVRKQIRSSVKELLKQLKNTSNKDESMQKEELKQILIHRAGLIFNLENTTFKNQLINKFTDTTEKFIDTAKKFDKNCTMDDITQAIRNVWIMNMIQAIANIEIQLTPSVFAYSMLYPCTDNYLDDPDIEKKSKNLFNDRLGKKLRGENVSASNFQETQIYRLVEMIEKEYSRNKYSDVYDSILGIHNGQVKSLKQQDTCQYNENKVLSISIEKGGTSVLADTYLVCGSPENLLSDLMFGFGFVLQLTDDLQDVKQDSINNHNTIFSMQIKKGKLDSLTDKLITFAVKAIEYESYSKSPYICDISRLIINNVLTLIFESVYNNRKFYSSKCIRNYKSFSPIDYRYLHRKMKKVQTEMNKIKKYF